MSSSTATKTESQRPTHYRSPRVWPTLRAEPITLPLVTPVEKPPITSLYVGLASLVGVGLSSLLFVQVGGLSSSLALVALSGVTAVASFITYFAQVGQARRDNAKTLKYYAQRLDQATVSEDGATPGDAEQRLLQEAFVRQQNDPPLFNPDPFDPSNTTLMSFLRRNPNPAQLWQRQPTDPDFLAARIGTGPVKPQFTVTIDQPANDLDAPLPNAPFERQRERARKMVARYAVIAQTPVVIHLRDYASIAIITGPEGDHGRELARSLIGQVALHHSPREAHVVVATGNSTSNQWLQLDVVDDYTGLPRMLSGPGKQWEAAIHQLHSELLQREQQLEAPPAERGASFLPHLVVFVDALQDEESLLLKNPAMDLALRRGKELGVTVISLHRTLAQAPEQAGAIVDTLTNTLTYARPNPPEPQNLTQVDSVSLNEFKQITSEYTRFKPEARQDQSLPAKVNLLDLFSPPIEDPITYDIEDRWRLTTAAASRVRQQNPSAPPSLAIPIGVSATGEMLSLDLVRDGPHGLLIGQTGSGKSELLRSIITAIAMSYSPQEAQFVLVDYKGGIELNAFSQLPHTLALLTNLDQSGQTLRFLTMLKSELDARQERRERDRGAALPHLFVVIDEFAEMVARSGPNDNVEAILERVLSILRLGRSLNVHLLFAAQRPEGSIINRLRGYVQYRLCLRTNTVEDSKEVLGVQDAALLPLNRPGRGYLLRGDAVLTQFQSARVALLYRPSGAPASADAHPVDEIVADRMAPLAGTYAADLNRWPSALPTPTSTQPTPLVLMLRGGLTTTKVEAAWNVGSHPALRRMVAPIGLYDRPIARERNWFEVDLLGHDGPLKGGPLAVMGDLNAGKTTTLRTLLLYFALTTTANDLRWYVLDPTGAFAGFTDLPHARDELEPREVNIIDGINTDQFQALKGRLQRFLAQPPSPNRPAALFLVDDYDELGERHQTELHELATLVAQSRDRRAYLALAATRQSYDGLPPQLLRLMATRILLYMESRQDMEQLAGTRPPFFPEATPGRGWAKTRFSLDEIQIAAPVYGLTELDREINLKALLEASVQARQRS